MMKSRVILFLMGWMAILPCSFNPVAWAESVAKRPWKCDLLLSHVGLFSSAQKFESIWGPKVFATLLNLQQVPRRGWLKRKIPKALAESVFSHTLKVTQAAELLARSRPELNKDKLVKMLMIHDIAEIRAPDFTPFDNVSHEKRMSIERGVLFDLVKSNKTDFFEVVSLWENFHERRSPEAQIAYQLDKLDAAIQAMRYEKLGYKTDDFYDDVLKVLTDPGLIRIFNVVRDSRFHVKDPYQMYFMLLGEN